MSASLVGSEMCIRDSQYTQQRIGQRWGRVARLQPLGGARARRGELWGGAVSYTHLTLPTICSV
eukprot:9477214-Alexandrium_andersonii.AAC.1